MTLLQKITTALLLMAMALPVLAKDQLTVTVDRDKVSTNETIELRVRFNAQVLFDEPDFSVLEPNFEILSTSKQQQFRNVNGRSESYTDWVLTLVPKKVGQLLIPPLKLDGAMSAPLTITVLKESTPKPFSADNPVFLETDINKSEVYVQEQLLVTYRFYMATDLQNLSMSPLEVADTEVLQIDDSQYQKLINGTQFRVVEVRFAIFPQASGEFTVPQLRFSGYLPRGGDPFFNSLHRNGKRFTLLSDTKNITVKPQPAGISGAWLPANGVALQDRWSDGLSSVKVGEPITRTITLTGLGTTATQLPELKIPEGDDYRLYPDQPELNQTISSDGIVGTRTETIAIVPNKAGTLNIPATRIEWWDTKNNKRQVTELAGQTINVLPSEKSAYVPSLQEQSADKTLEANTEQTSSQWFYGSLALNLLLIIAIIWLASRGKSVSKPTGKLHSSARAETEKQLYEAIRSAAKKQNTKALRESLITWAQYYWRNQGINTLQQLAELIGDEAFCMELSLIDKALYGNSNATVDYDKISNTIKRLRADGTIGGTVKSNDLRPLYPA